MQDILLQTGLLFASMEGSPEGRSRTPTDVGNSLFRDLLKRKSSGSDEDGLVPGLCSPYTGGQTPAQEAPLEECGNILSFLKKGSGRLGLPAGQLRLPTSSLPQLSEFLQNRGFGKEIIAQWIQSSRDAQGFVHLDRLMAKVQGSGVSRGRGTGTFIQSQDLPQVQTLLLKQGLGVSEVREVIEKSLVSGGDLAVERLSGALKKYFSVVPGPKEMLSLLSAQGIEGRTRIEGKGFMDRSMKEALENYSAADSLDVQKRIKQELTHLLREKGVPPQEVKSFLEGLSVERARSLATSDQGTLKGGGTARNDASAEILDQVVLKQKAEWSKGAWHEKIMDILNKERLVLNPGSDKTVAQGEASLKLNTAALFQLEEQKSKGVFVRQVPVEAQNSEVLSHGPRSKRNAQESEAGTQTRKVSLSSEEPTASFTLQKAERGSTEGNVWASTRPAAALPEPLPKIMDRMMWMFQAGEQKSRIVISPPELGRLDLDLVIRQGHIQANLSAESLQVKELIDANLSQLRQQLSDQGLVVDKFEVTVGLDDRRYPEGEAQTSGGRKGRSSRGSKGGEVSVSSVESPGDAPIGNLYQIDVHV
ncbi:MAG: flagellar hook-length control protein FliK [Deltaproteobacteria bacterium]|nr:flagellar hook-length control protein FliK [Deltaproteobacteria bacterium]